MHHIRGFYGGVGDGWAGFLAGVGVLILGLVGLPRARLFLLGSILLGLIAIPAMRAWYRHRADEVKRLSILR